MKTMASGLEEFRAKRGHASLRSGVAVFMRRACGTLAERETVWPRNSLSR